MISVIIPSYKDPYLQKTIDSLLENAEGEVEVIAVLDGYWQELKSDPRVRIVHLGKNRGMRGAINAGVAIARGDFLMRTDEHASFGKGYDVILTRDCQPNWMMTPRRFFLDPVKWEVMDIPPVDYSRLAIQDCGNGVRKFAGAEWKSRAHERKDIMIDEIQAMQGSCWFMPHKWWDEVIGELQIEGYGPLYQDSHEMVFKTWKAGGKLMVDKNTWHAHKHRSFPRTHNNGTPENPSNNEECWTYSLKVWEDYYNEIKKTWL
jgi:glycosyltransferase involved in cell wall biosynthesis